MRHKCQNFVSVQGLFQVHSFSFRERGRKKWAYTMANKMFNYDVVADTPYRDWNDNIGVRMGLGLVDGSVSHFLLS
jgi:hypothetical protein